MFFFNMHIYYSFYTLDAAPCSAVRHHTTLHGSECGCIHMDSLPYALHCMPLPCATVWQHALPPGNATQHTAFDVNATLIHQNFMPRSTAHLQIIPLSLLCN